MNFRMRVSSEPVPVDSACVPLFFTRGQGCRSRARNLHWIRFW